jgi:transcription initiation factor TFIIIB Brf1 subunit/transcription initiation factor TFIIB
MFGLELTKLAKKMSIRQQVVATAEVYMRRYYLKVDIRRTNPYLVLCTAFYLACKVEECPQHIRLVVAEALRIWPGKSIAINVWAKLTDYLRFHIRRYIPTRRVRIQPDLRTKLTTYHPPPLSLPHRPITTTYSLGGRDTTSMEHCK